MKLHKEKSGSVTNPGNFYRELAILKEADMVVPTEAGDDQKTIPYCIAPQGEREFDRWLCDPSTPESQAQMPTWILFAGRVPRDVRNEILDRLHDRIWIQGKAVEHARVDALRLARNNGQVPTYHPAPLLLLRELKHLTADLEFLQEFRAELEALDADPR
jgi:hypothetical protein